MKIDDPRPGLVKTTQEIAQDDRIIVRPVSVSDLPRQGPKFEALDLTDYELPGKCCGFIIDKSRGFQIMLKPDCDEYFNPEKNLEYANIATLTNGDWIGKAYKKHSFNRSFVCSW